MKYDALLKSLFQSSANCFVPSLVGCRAVEQLSVEFPSVQARIPDLVMLLEDGRILHLELQSDNNPDMPRRMLSYWLLLTERYPETVVAQTVLYFGPAKMTMASTLSSDCLEYSYRLVDIRGFPAAEFLESDCPDARVLALLCDGIEPRAVTSRIIASWRDLPSKDRLTLFEKLVIASGLRGLRHVVEEEIQAMAINENVILENEWFQDWKAQGVAEGIEKGIERGIERGRRQEAVSKLLGLIARRFGPVPDWASARASTADLATLDLWFDRSIDARDIDEIFA